MNGRDFFDRFASLIKCGEMLFKCIPKSLCNYLWITSGVFPNKFGSLFRYFLARRLCRHVGQNVYFGRYVTIKNWHCLSIGDNCSFHEYVYLDALGSVVIGDDVSIAHGSSIVSFEHTYDDPHLPIKYNQLNEGKIHIGNDCWIGAGSRVLSLSNVPTRSILAAGSVFTRKSETFSGVYAGAPAKLVKRFKLES